MRSPRSLQKKKRSPVCKKKTDEQRDALTAQSAKAESIYVCMSYEEEDTRMSYEEEDTCKSREHICMYIRMCMHVYVCMDVYIYIHIYSELRRLMLGDK